MGTRVTHKVLKAMTLFGGVQCTSVLGSLVRAKFISLWIGPVGVGLFGIFNNVLEMLSGATQLNLRQSAVREVSAASDAEKPRIASAVRWWAMRLGMVGAVVMLAASPWLSLFSFGDYSWWWAFALLAVAMVALAITAGEQALMQGMRQLRELARASIIGIIAGTALSVPLYYWLGEGSILPSILIFALVGTIASCCCQNVKHERISRRENASKGISFLKLGVYLTVSSLAATGASYIFLSYLNTQASTQMVGIYQAGYTLVVKYVGMIFVALSMEYYPRMVRVSESPRRASLAVSHEMSLLMSVMLPVVIVFVALDEVAIRLLYSEEFLSALPLVTIGVGGAVPRAISYCMAYVILARGDGRIYVVTELASAAIGLALNIFMWRGWGMAGLGVSYVLWYVAYVAMVWAVYRWRYGMWVSGKSLCIALAAVVITAGAIWLRLGSWWQPLCMLLPAAGVIYCACKK